MPLLLFTEKNIDDIKDLGKFKWCKTLSDLEEQSNISTRSDLDTLYDGSRASTAYKVFKETNKIEAKYQQEVRPLL